jgi:peptidoglycan/xylan/chitin deacetylase (PgdA/CDA1 family)
MFKPLFGLVSPAGTKAPLSILIFHRVLDEPDPLFPDEMHARRFDEVCAWLKRWFQVLPLDVAVSSLKAGSLPARAACITFDDGYADNFKVAMPILQRHGLVATFFIATGFLDGGRMWNDTIIESVRKCAQVDLDLSPIGLGRHPVEGIDNKRSAINQLINAIKYQPVADRVALTRELASLSNASLPDDLMMTSREVKSMRAGGMQIGAHTQSHPILARLGEAEAREEIQGSKVFLEALLGERIGLFAYPNGKPGEDYSPENIETVKSLGFDAAVSTQWGVSRPGDDLFQIRRFTPWDRSRLRFGARLLQNLRSH